MEHRSIVEHLNNKVTGLIFKLVDSKRWLHQQDAVTRLMLVVQKKRSLLLFNNMVLCASLKHKSKKGGAELVDSKRWLHWQDVVTRLMFSQG